jgi:predicted DNA-binding protein (MmcQ/YjbR family)
MPPKRLSGIALALPGATMEMQGDHASFLVKKKVFAWFLNNHHGDGIVSVCVKALPGDNQRLIETDSIRFYPPAYMAHRGWVGYRLDVGTVDWGEVKELVAGSYQLVITKRVSSASSPPSSRKSRP